jgi:3-dehydroquinate synthase
MNKSGHVYLTGFTGSGKTSIGTELAHRLKLDFVDLDTEVAKKSGKDLPTLFAEDGENTFRMIEREILEDTAGEVDRGANKVVALGGGTLINPAVHEIVSDSGVLIWLRARWHTLFNRLSTVSDRPLLQPAETRHEFITFNRPFYEARVPGYSTCDLVIDVDDETPSGDAATSIIRMMDCAWFLTVRLGERTHNVLCDSGLLARTGQMLYHLGLLPRGLVWLITTSALDADDLPLAKIVREDLESTRQQVRVLRIPDGEQAKTPEEVTRIHEALVGAGTSREDLIIALGGGAVNDVAGFAAATYMRGIDIVQIPTTLVGMVDAALGGKTAINHPRAKNLIGAFHQPRAILIDPVVLNTTADEYYLAGLAELVKYGCIADRTIIEEAEQNWTDILNRPTWEEKWTRANWEELKGNPWSLIPLMRKGLSIKARLVSADERELTGQRVLLNFGHTFAHGFEHASGYAIPHGQAVALGIRAGFRLGRKRGTVTEEDVDRMDRLLNVLAPVALIKNVDNLAILAAVRHDKKHGRTSLRFLIPLGIGAVEIFDDVTEEEILQAIESLRSYGGRDTV